MARQSQNKQQAIEDSVQNINDNLGNIFSGGTPITPGLGSCRTLLNQKEYEDLYERYRVIENLINLLPEDSNHSYPEVKNKEESGIDNKDLAAVFNEIPCLGEPLEPLNLRAAITLANIYGRLYGDISILRYRPYSLSGNRLSRKCPVLSFWAVIAGSTISDMQ